MNKECTKLVIEFNLLRKIERNLLLDLEKIHPTCFGCKELIERWLDKTRDMIKKRVHTMKKDFLKDYRAFLEDNCKEDLSDEDVCCCELCDILNSIFI